MSINTNILPIGTYNKEDYMYFRVDGEVVQSFGGPLKEKNGLLQSAKKWLNAQTYKAFKKSKPLKRPTSIKIGDTFISQVKVKGNPVKTLRTKGVTVIAIRTSDVRKQALNGGLHHDKYKVDASLNDTLRTWAEKCKSRA